MLTAFPARARTLVVLALLAFDAATIIPAAAGCYVLKRALHLDIVRGVDMLPDQLIERALVRVARQFILAT